MQLQACTKCGAQFDVSDYSPGQAFKCGACGEVLTTQAAPSLRTPPARAPAGRTPAARTPAARTPGASRAPSTPPAARGRTPGAPARRSPPPAAPGPKAVKGGPAAARRGPQYQPVQRAGAAPPAPAGPAARKAPGRSRAPAGGAEAPPRGGRRAPRTSAGPNKAVLLGAGALVLVVVVGLVATGGGDKGSSKGGGTDVAGTNGGAAAATPTPAPAESVKDVMGDYGTSRPTTLRDYRAFIDRLVRLEGEQATNALRTVYEDFIEGPGRDDKAAREFLGYKEFDYEIPEDIAFREYPYIEAVKAAYNKHWFGPDEADEYEIAMRARKETEEHRERLINDHRFLASDGIRALIAHDEYFKDFNYATRWEEPYLICYSSKDHMSEYELLSIEDKDERRLRLKEIEKKKQEFESVLDEKAAIFKQLYKNFMERYEKELSLKPLMDEYGGRPDYPLGQRSFEYGCPLVIWIFDSRAAFDEYHTKVKQEMIPHNVAGYFSPRTGFVYLYDEGDNPSNRVFEINKNVHEGTHQLEFWFTRQRNRWAKPIPGQDFFGEGIAEYVGAVQMQPDRTLKFIGVNVPRLQSMQRGAQMLKSQGNEYKLFPVDKLVGFSSYGEVQQWGATTWQLNPGLVLGMFYEQSWAFVYFLNEYKNGKYKEQFLKFFDLVLHRETGYSKGDQAFKEAFRIRDEDDFQDLNEEFHAFIRDDLMKRNPAQWEYTPPKRGEVK